MSTFKMSCVGALVAITCVSAARAGCTPGWDRTVGSPGVSGAVNGLASFNDGTGTRLFATGNFASAGADNTVVNRIARWNGVDWEALGSGLNLTGFDLVGFNDGSGPALYVGGSFTTAGGSAALRVARWNGSAWSPVGAGFNGNVLALAVFNGALYAGGDFNMSGTTAVSRVAVWNPGTQTWGPVGAGFANFAVRDLHVHSGSLYAAGDFTMSGMTAINRIARWDGAAWQPLGAGVGNNSVLTMASFQNTLYVGGTFSNAGGSTILRLARWNGVSWSTVGANGIFSDVTDLAPFDDGSGPSLFVAGNFTSVDMMPVNRLARWNGSAWFALDGGASNRVDALGVFTTPTDSSLFVGGTFLTVGTGDFNSAGRIAEWVGCPVSASCPADLNGDGQVQAADLATLLTNWGPCPGCPADLNGDNQVQAADLANLLTNWGPCN